MEYLITKDSKNKFRYVILDSFWDDDSSCFKISRITAQYKGKEIQQPIIEIYKGKVKRSVTEQKDVEYNSIKKKYQDKGYILVFKHPNEYSEEELKDLYGEVKTNQFGVIKPQLAKQSEKVTNPKIFDKEWFISRKLDGLKALFYYKDGEIHTASRGGTHYDYSTNHLRTNGSLLNFFKAHPTVILDGELFRRGKTLQQISGAARLEKNAVDCDFLQYWIYDCYDSANTEIPAKERYNEILINELNHKFDIFVYISPEDDDIEDPIRILHHEYVTGWDNMKSLHDKWVFEGFEGAVLTDLNKPYKPGSRSNNLIKIKEYLDNTYKVIGYELGLRGSEDMVFICEMEDGRTFKASPLGDRATKQEYIDNFEEKYKNHLGDCKYFTLSDTGIPTQPKFIYFRFDLE